MSRPTPLRAVKVQSFTHATPAGLTGLVNAWITANAGQRTMLALVFTADGGIYSAFLTFTE